MSLGYQQFNGQICNLKAASAKANSNIALTLNHLPSTGSAKQKLKSHTSRGREGRKNVLHVTWLTNKVRMEGMHILAASKGQGPMTGRTNNDVGVSSGVSQI